MYNLSYALKIILSPLYILGIRRYLVVIACCIFFYFDEQVYLLSGTIFFGHKQHSLHLVNGLCFILKAGQLSGSANGVKLKHVPSEHKVFGSSPGRSFFFVGWKLDFFLGKKNYRTTVGQLIFCRFFYRSLNLLLQKNLFSD